MKNKEIILGLDISSSCIGYCIFMEDGSETGKIITLGHVSPNMASNKKTGMEALFIKKRIFKEEFFSKYKDFHIDKVIIEEPIMGNSKNINTIALLLRFNGMISDCIYEELGIVPNYISSYDARLYSFPELLSIRKFNKKGEIYSKSKILKSLKDNHLVLFASYPWDIDKKQIMVNKTMELFPNINWIYDKYGDMKKENFDANDALITCIGFKNKMKYGEINPQVLSFNENKNEINYQIKVWDKIFDKKITL